MRLIGLTGGIATGKTTVADNFYRTKGVPILKVDEISNLVTKKGTDALSKVVKHFGSKCLLEDGTLNRSYLRQILISDKEQAKALQDIVIPAISNFVSLQLKKFDDMGVDIVLVENAVMFEKETYQNYDEIIVVTCSKEAQLERLMERDDQTKEQAEAMLSIQMPLLQKEKLATYLIRNDGDFEDVYSEVDRVWEEIKGD